MNLNQLFRRSWLVFVLCIIFSPKIFAQADQLSRRQRIGDWFFRHLSTLHQPTLKESLKRALTDKNVIASNRLVGLIPEQINFQNDEGYTVLMVTAENGNGTRLERLIQAGADLNLQNQNGKTALMLAADKGHGGVVEQLLTHGARLPSGRKIAKMKGEARRILFPIAQDRSRFIEQTLEIEHGVPVGLSGLVREFESPIKPSEH